MKPPEQVKRELAARWLEKAEGDWQICHRLTEDPQPYEEAIAFHAQQAAEKYIKGYLTWEQVEFPKTHDIERLLELVATRDQVLSENLREAAALTAYAVEYRYPGDYPPVTTEDARQAVAVSDHVRDQFRIYLRDKLDL